MSGVVKRKFVVEQFSGAVLFLTGVVVGRAAVSS